MYFLSLADDPFQYTNLFMFLKLRSREILVQVYIVELGRADIAAIQQLYGPKTSKTLTTRFFSFFSSSNFEEINFFSSTPSPSLSPAAWLNRPWLSNSQVNKKPIPICFAALWFYLFFKNKFTMAWSEVS